MYRLFWTDPSGLGRWRSCAEAAEVRQTATRVVAAGGAIGGEMRIDFVSDGGWSVVSSAVALARWGGGAPPPRLIASASRVDDARLVAEQDLLSRVATALSAARSAGLLEAGQAADIDEIVRMAVKGEGPAGRGIDPDTIKPTVLSREDDS